jgi:hypothetical protein
LKGNVSVWNQTSRNDKAIYRRLEHSADLSQVEGAGPAVEKRRAAQYQKTAAGIGNGKVQRALERCRRFTLIAAQGERRGAHQLKKNE